MVEPNKSGQWVTRYREFVPREARSISNNYLSKSREISELALSVRSDIEKLKNTWSGKASEQFLYDYCDEPASVELLSEQVQDARGRIQSLMVIEIERIFMKHPFGWIPP